MFFRKVCSLLLFADYNGLIEKRNTIANKQKNLLLLVMFFYLLLPSFSVAQRFKDENFGSISGAVYEAKSGIPVEFATVALINKSDSAIVTGLTTNDKGRFLFEKVKPGQYFTKISFVGLDNYVSKSFTIKTGTKFDLGKINLSQKNVVMKDVTVSADRASISYQIDKKVINVAENLTSLSGTAVDVLESVPSVTVDIDGNVSLRGSGNFQVLIDGRPSILSSSEALDQIPASSIQNIEIITNPSAKYDPAGTAGIINVIMKKNENWGYSGTLNLNGGINNKYGTDVIGSMRNSLVEATLGVNYDSRNMDGSVTERNWSKDAEKISYYNSNGDNKFDREAFNLRGSLAFDFGEKKLLTFGGRYSYRSNDGGSNTDYSEWSSINLDPVNYLSKSDNSRSSNNYSFFVNYKHPFNSEGHEIYLEASLDHDNSDGNNSTILYEQKRIESGKKNYEKAKDTEFRGKVDYVYPINAEQKIEAGYKGSYESENEINSLSVFENDLVGFIDDPRFFSDGKYYTGEHSLYAVYTDKFGDFGYKVGVRNEYTGRDIEVASSNMKYVINRWEYFPSLHVSYDLGAGTQIMSSYTKRINRPNGWDLEPVVTWMDAYNVRKGNPGLLPEYIDSYELGYQMMLDKSLFSIDMYYRKTINKIERTMSLYDNDVTMNTSENVGKDYSLGAELFFNFDPISNWNVNLMGNLYNYEIDAFINGSDVERSSFNWSVRFNNSVKFGSSTSFQFNAQYNSPSVSSQGKRENYISANMGIKQELFNKFMVATLQVRDIFRSARFEFVNESTNFYRYRYAKRESPVVMLSLRFLFNNFKIEEHEGEGVGGGEEY